MSASLSNITPNIPIVSALAVEEYLGVGLLGKTILVVNVIPRSHFWSETLGYSLEVQKIL